MFFQNLVLDREDYGSFVDELPSDMCNVWSPVILNFPNCTEVRCLEWDKATLSIGSAQWSRINFPKIFLVDNFISESEIIGFSERETW